jgi:hypothetical protein
MSRGQKQVLILLMALTCSPLVASADTITFTSTNSYDSAWWWAGPNQPLWGSILSGTATQGSTGNTVDISCGYECWVSWGTGAGSATSSTSVAFGSAGSYLWVYGNDGSGNKVNMLDGSFSGTTLTDNGDGTYTLSSNFSGTLSPILLALLGMSSSGTPVDVSGTFTAILSGSFDPNSGGFGWYDPSDPNSWGTGVLQVVVADDFPTNGGNQTPVPEPGTLAMFGTGLLGVAGLLRRKLTP